MSCQTKKKNKEEKPLLKRSAGAPAARPKAEDPTPLFKSYMGYSREQIVQNLLSRVTRFRPGTVFRFSEMVSHCSIGSRDRYLLPKDFARKALEEGLVTIEYTDPNGMNTYKRV